MNKTIRMAAIALASVSSLPAEATVRLPLVSPIVEADWQSPETLPRRFRDHCFYDVYGRRSYCSDHCGSEYQFYYCSRQSSGCCHVGFGYCDWQGFLRCHP